MPAEIMDIYLFLRHKQDPFARISGRQSAGQTETQTAFSAHSAYIDRCLAEDPCGNTMISLPIITHAAPHSRSRTRNHRCDAIDRENLSKNF
jgi:hypothetical protein